MSDFFAEATVRLTPDMTGFVTDLRTEVKAAVEKVEGTPAAKIKVSPALTRDFVGNLRKQVNEAVARAQRGIKPIQIRAVLTDTSRAAIAREVRTGAQTVRAATRPAGAAPAAAVVTATTQATTAIGGLASVEKVLADAERARIPILGQLVAEQNASNKATVAGAKSHLASVGAIGAETESTAALTQARQSLALASRFELGSRLRAQAIQGAARSSALASITALNAEERAAADAFSRQIRATAGAADALGEHSRAAATASRNMSQLRRGVLSTTLSFLGIRGATLAASARFLAGAAAIAVFAKALQSSTQFADQLNVFRATASATATEMERVRDTARALGADISLPGVTAGDAAESMTELAKAGLAVEDSIAGARGVLQLATAAAIDNAQAVELAANAINAFQLAGRDATRVADTFANAANAAQGSIVDIGIAFQQASAAGRQVGLSFEDTTTFLTVLARNGLKGSDAGTSLRTALIRLIKPTEGAAKALKSLGVETRDASGNLRPDVFIQLAEATKNLSPAMRDARLALIGGQDAFRAITILGRQSIDEFIKLRQELREQGTAADLAAARTQGLRGSLEALSNTLSTAGVNAGAKLTPALQSVVEGLTGAVSAMTQSSLAAKTFSGSVDFLEISISALGTTLSTIGPLISGFISVQASVANAIGVPTILAAVAAYKLFPAVLARATAAQTAFAASTTRVAFALRLLRDSAVTGKFAFLAAQFNLVTIAATIAAAAIFFVATRESAAEKATRKLTEATDGLVQANERLKTSADARRDTALGVSAAELGVLTAQQAAAKAREQLAQGGAGKGTFARTKLELELAVALDNVKIAQNGLADAVERANAAHDEAIQASVNQASALAEERDAILRVVTVAQKRAQILRDRGGTVLRDGRAQSFSELAAIKLVSAELQKRAQAAREEGSAESIATARRLELLDQVAASVNKIPTERTISIALDTPNLETALRELEAEFGATGEDLKTQLFKGLTTLGTSPEVTAAIIDLADKLGIELVPRMNAEGRLGGSQLVHGIKDAIDQTTPEAVSAVNRLMAAIKASLGRGAGLDVQKDLAVIASPATGATLPVLQQQLAEARGREADARAAIAASPVGETPTLRKALRQAIADQRSIIEEIRGINETLASDAQAAADDAKEKQDRIQASLLEAMGFKRERRQERIEDAQATPGVRDDLTATRALRQLARAQIQRVLERIASAKKEGQNVETLIAGLKTLRGIYRDLGREVRELQRTRQQEIQDRIAESNQLDIEFAQTTENRNAEIRAREREIGRLKKLQSDTKKGTIEYRRLRNLIAEQQAAIDDLRKQQGDKQKSLLALQRQEFDFLQRIQGFTANLLGNLIPGGITGGLVGGQVGPPGGGPIGAVPAFGQPGGPQPGGGVIPGFGAKAGASVATAFQKAQTGIDAQKDRGFSAGQGNTTNELLRRILREIHKQNRGSEHPEAKTQRKTGTATYDYGYQGPGM